MSIKLKPKTRRTPKNKAKIRIKRRRVIIAIEKNSWRDQTVREKILQTNFIH